MKDRILKRLNSLSSGEYFEIHFDSFKVRVSAFVTMQEPDGSDRISMVIGFSDGSGFLASPDETNERIYERIIESAVESQDRKESDIESVSNVLAYCAPQFLFCI